MMFEVIEPNWHVFESNMESVSLLVYGIMRLGKVELALRFYKKVSIVATCYRTGCPALYRIQLTLYHK